jgi:hypothetical protein
MIAEPRSAESGGRHLPDPDGWWSDGARRALQVLAVDRGIFSADDLFAPPFALPDPPHPSHVGSLFAAARAEGIIRPVGFAASKRRSRNGGALRLWRGTPKARLLFGGDVR